jgi:hypothetical protein
MLLENQGFRCSRPQGRPDRKRQDLVGEIRHRFRKRGLTEEEDRDEPLTP